MQSKAFEAWLAKKRAEAQEREEAAKAQQAVLRASLAERSAAAEAAEASSGSPQGARTGRSASVRDFGESKKINRAIEMNRIRCARDISSILNVIVHSWRHSGSPLITTIVFLGAFVMAVLLGLGNRLGNAWKRR